MQIFLKEIVTLQNTHKGCSSTIAHLQAQVTNIQNNPSEGNDSANKNFDQLKKKHQLLQSSLNILQKQSDQDKAELAKLSPEIKRLTAALAQFRNKQVFANSATDLAPTHSQLFTRLQTLEDQDADALQTAYASAGTELNSKRTTRVQFGTGSVTVKSSDLSNIEAVASGSAEGDSFLIVGYASKKGDRDINKSLSSKRATAVAKALLSKLKGKNHVQAVYLGETKRFGSTRKNQVVEIWQVSK